MHGHSHPWTLAQLHENADFIKALHAVSGIGMREANYRWSR